MYGYIGEIKLLPADKERGAKTPALMQIVVRLPFKYGKSRLETEDSWLGCRVSAFISAACFANTEAVLRVGSPVTGFLEGSNIREHFGDQLTGWDGCRAADWKLLDPASFPARDSFYPLASYPKIP